MTTLLPIKGIDGHAHVFAKDLPLTAQRRYAPAYDALPASYFAALAAMDVSHGVLVQPSFLGHDNHFLLHCLDQWPGRLRGIVMTSPDTPLTTLDDWHARGVVGVRENLIGKPVPDFASPIWQIFLKRLADKGWHLEIQIEASRLDQWTGPLLQSGVRVVIDHFGRVDPATGLNDPGFARLLALSDATGAARQVWVKISGVYRNTTAEASAEAATALALNAWRALRERFGSDRLVWGSDWPHTQFEATQNPETVSRLRDALLLDVAQNGGVPAAERQALLIDSPKVLFGFDR